MARIRSIHPNACKSRKLARSSAEAERCYWRLQPHCDDEGRVEDEPDVLASLMFQAGVLGDDLDTQPVPPNDVDRWLNELAQVGLIARYATASHHVIQVTQWSEYQHPKRPTKSRFDAPPDANSPTRSPHVPHTSPTRSPRSGVEWSGEGEGAGATRGAIDALLSDATVCVMGRRNTVDRSETKADPSAWLAAAARDIRQELLAAVRDANQPTDSTDWANTISDPPKPPPARPEQTEATRNRDCQLCGGSMMASDEKGAYPCPVCNP